MIERFLKAKHWQIFLLTFGLQILMQSVLPLSFIGSSSNTMTIMSIFTMIIGTIIIGVLLGWFWSIGVGLQRKISVDVRMKVGRFKSFLLIILLFFTFVIGLSLFSICRSMGIGQTGNGSVIIGMMNLILPLFLFSMYCMFYTLHFVAKTIKTVELQREVSFSDYAGEFFMLLFFPIGIWIVQPKINKVFENR